MAISFDQAKQIALQHIGPECGLMEENTIEKPYGWYFIGQSKEFLRTGDEHHMLVGSGGFIVERENGRIYEFGSAYSTERNFAAYEWGLKYESYDLTITKIRDLEKTLHHLLTLNLTYVIPEVAHGRTWRIPKPYTREQLAQKLRVLPCIFENCRGFYFKYEQLLELERARCCEYQLAEHHAAR